MDRQREKALFDYIFKRPIEKKKDFLVNKGKIDRALRRRTPEEHHYLCDYVKKYKEFSAPSLELLETYQGFMQSLSRGEEPADPALPVEYFFDESDMGIQILNKFVRIIRKQQQKIFLDFKKLINKKVKKPMAIAGYNVVGIFYSRLAEKMKIKLMKDSAIKFTFGKIIFNTLTRSIMLSSAKRYNRHRRLCRFIQYVSLVRKRPGIEAIVDHVRAINLYYRRLDKGIQLFIKNITLGKTWFAMKMIRRKLGKSRIAERIFSDILMIKFRFYGEDFFKFFRKLSKSSWELSVRSTRLRSVLLKKIVLAAKNRRAEARFPRLCKEYFRARAKTHNTELLFLLIGIRKYKILRKLLMEASIKFSKSRLVQISDLRTKTRNTYKQFKKYLLSIKRNTFLKLKETQKYYKYPCSAKVVLHKLNSDNDSTAKAFNNLLVMPMNRSNEQSTSCLRCFSVIESSIVNQKDSVRDIDSDNNKLSLQINKSKTLINTLKVEIDKLDRLIQSERSMREDRSFVKKTLENLNTEIIEVEKISRFLQRDRKEAMESISARDSEIKSLIITSNSKKMMILDLESKIESLESEYVTKCEEISILQSKSNSSTRRVNLSPISSTKKNSFYKNSFTIDSPVSKRSAKHVSERSNEFSSRKTMPEFEAPEQVYIPNIAGTRKRLFEEEIVPEKSSWTMRFIIIALIVMIAALLIAR